MFEFGISIINECYQKKTELARFFLVITTLFILSYFEELIFAGSTELSKEP